MVSLSTMPSFCLSDVHSCANAQSDRGLAIYKRSNPEHTHEGMQATFTPSSECPSNDAPHTQSVSTSSPRSSGSSYSLEEELVVVFESKANYMNQEAFDEAMCRHGIQEEVTHRIARVETKDRNPIPDAQWDDPCANLFPVRCIYQKLVRDLPEVSAEQSPMPSLPSSIPTTPELPMRDLAADSSGLAGHLLACQLSTQLLGGPTPLPLGAASPKPSAWYTVTFCGGISVREAPDSQAPATGVTLPCNEVFEVSDSVLGLDRRLYLKLANGCGWVFDDSHLFPGDPSVRKLETMSDCTSLVGYCNVKCGNRFATVPQHRTVRGHGPMPPALTHTATVPIPGTAIPFATAPPSTFACPDRTLSSTVIPLASVPYQVQSPSGVHVRVAPSLHAATTEIVLYRGDVFHVCESILGGDGRQYLRLADGRGWVLAETLPQDHDATGSQGPLPVGQVMSSQPASQQRVSHDDKNHIAKAKDSAPKPHVPYWVRLRRAKQLGLPMGQKKSRSGAAKV